MANDEQAANEVQKPKPKLPLKTVLILLGILLIEGGGISLFWAMKGGPKQADATEAIEATEESPEKTMMEIMLAENYQVVNYTIGKIRIMVTLDAVAQAQQANQEKLQTKVKEHKNEILNTIRVVVMKAQPEDIKKDPELKKIRRQIKAGVEKIVGNDLVEDILLPVWQPFDSD